MFLGFWNACKQKFIFRGGGGILGCLGRPTPPPGGRAGSENNTLLPMTMICDRLKFWSGPAWRSKVIIRKPWRRKNKKNKNKKFWQNHKAFPAGSRECLITPPMRGSNLPCSQFKVHVCLFYSHNHPTLPTIQTSLASIPKLIGITVTYYMICAEVVHMLKHHSLPLVSAVNNLCTSHNDKLHQNRIFA